MADFDKRKSFMTVGKALPGMMDLNRNAGSNVQCSDRLMELLEEANGENGCIRILITEQIIGKKMFRINVADRSFGEKMDDLQSKLEEDEPAMFVLFKGKNDCVLLKFISDNAKTRQKMMYASSTSSLKQAIGSLSSKMKISEYSCSTIEEFCYSEYKSHQDVEAPLTEAEINRKEEEGADTAGAYSLLARLSVNPGGGFALPGLSSGNVNPKFLRDPSKDKKPSSSDDEGSDDYLSSDNDEDDEVTEEEEEEEEEVVKKPARASKRLSVQDRMKAFGGKSKSKSPADSKRKSSKRNSKKPIQEEEEEEQPYPYNLEQLKEMKKLGEFDDYMDRKTLELYLSTDEFEKHFKMNKAQYKKLPTWKKQNLKKKVGLF